MTERDVEIVRWLGRHKVATAEQVMRRFGMQRSKAYQRLAALVRNGLVRHDQGVRSARLYLATRKGLSTAELDLPRCIASPATVTHDLAVVDAAIPLEGSSVRFLLTEREIRRADQHGQHSFRITRWGAADADQRGMWPDLVVVDRLSYELHAIEVELSLKKRERIVDKLRAYHLSSYRTITYLCATAGIARAVAQADRTVGLGDRLIVQRTIEQAAPEDVDGVERILSAAHRERERADNEARRAAEAAQLLEDERRAAFRLVEDIARYLTADRAEQRATRERWQRLADRVARAREGRA